MGGNRGAWGSWASNWRHDVCLKKRDFRQEIKNKKSGKKSKRKNRKK